MNLSKAPKTIIIISAGVLLVTLICIFIFKGTRTGLVDTNNGNMIRDVKLEREVIYDSIFGFSYVETMTKDSLYGIESTSGATIIPPVYNGVWLNKEEYKTTIFPTFMCVRRNKPEDIFALYDTAGREVISIDKRYNFIALFDNFIICGIYKGKKWYKKDGNETDFYNLATYDGNGELKIDTNEGFDYFFEKSVLEIEDEEDKPLKQEHIKGNYLQGLRPIIDGNLILGHTFVYFDLVTWEPVFTECTNNLLICYNGFFNFSNGQYICVYNKNRECIIPFDRHYKVVNNIKDGIISYFIVGYDDDCWGICDKNGTEIIQPSYKYRNGRGICYVKGYGFRYSPDEDAHFLSDEEIWESTESMNVYLDELSVGHTL